MNTLVRYLLQILIIIPCMTNASVPKLPHCTDKNTNGLVLINTLDGKLSVLNYDTGQILWNMETGPGPMLSSNIDRLELTNNGHWVRIIPSLAGNLYKFNGDTIDPIPLTADNLLATSFQYSDDIVIVGGKEIRSYGVMLHSGKVLYDCSLSGCINKTKNTDYEDFILVERNTHIIRAVESRFGVEKWNFSVGQLNIKLQQLNCRTDSTHKINFNMKQVISEGLIYAFGDSEKILWKHQFDTPIVSMWTWDGHNIKSVNLFSNNHYSWGMMNINSNIAPALYVGMHQKQLYVQESELMQRFLNSNKQKNSGDITELNSVSQIPWKPFPASSSALSVIDPEKTLMYETENNPTEISTTALSVLYASEYINGNGFYLYPNEPVDENCANNNTIETVEIEDLETPVQLIITSIWYFWKEIVVIAITTAVVVNMFITHRFFKKYQPKEKYILVERHIPINTPNESDRKTSESSDKEFVSRYLTDFIPIQCLGKGGFGIVFEAKNKIDECNYAVKKITLPKKKESRDRVMREVKTLAKLDHQHIVRYYNAWLETPPPEWITNFEEEWKRDVISTDGLEYTSQLSSCPSPIKKQNSSVVINMINNNSNLPYNDSDLKLPNDVDSDSFIVFANESDKVSSQSEEPKEIKQDSISKDSVINDTTETFDLLHNSKSSPTASFPESSTVFLYIQMQLCQKESLRDWLKKHVQRDVDFINFMFFQIVSAVEYVHTNGLIHRDLKPSNIFFSINGDIKIGDFGLVTENEECIAVESGDECLNDCSCKQNKHTQAVGTQLYMSPEQLKGLNYNFKVDIYSLGVIFFEMLVPFHTTMERNKTLLDLRQNKFPHDFCRSYKKEHQLVSRMLSQNPDARPTSMEIKTKLPSYSPDLE